MPEISRFYGIIIRMLFNEHNPPHFHAEYGDHRIAIRIDDLSVMKGGLPPRALGLVMEWASLHQTDLRAEWDSIRQGTTFRIEPLP